MRRRNAFWTWAVLMIGASMLLFGAQSIAAERPRPNIVVFTVDDMDITSVNCYGNPLPNLTPNMDRLASQGMRFLHAHVSTAICMPCRQSMMTGLYAYHNGSFGFIEVAKNACPSLSGLLMDNGYYTASIGKGRDYHAFPWDRFSGLGRDGWHSRRPSGFYDKAKEVIRHAQAAGKPFYMGVNTSDPHRPWPGSQQEKDHVKWIRKTRDPDSPDYPPAEPVCSVENVPLLPYLPDLPDIRKETVQYLTSVKRADETLGRILELLDEEGLTDNTLFIFFSDHDAAMPTAKQNCYAHSTATPLMVRWPGEIQPGSVDGKDMVSTLDLMPTILDVLHLPLPPKQDGRSLRSLLEGKEQAGRDSVFTTYNYKEPGLLVFPMRAVHTRRWSYVFNPWSDGIKKRQNENGNPTDNQTGLTFKAMQKAALTDPEMKKRVETILLRRREELFDLQNDPYSFTNLADRPEYKSQLETMRALMMKKMEASEDPLLDSLKNNTSYPAEWDQKQ